MEAGNTVKLANSNAALRKALESISNVQIGNHRQEIEKLAELHSHTIKFVRYKETDEACVAYALGLADNRKYRSLTHWAKFDDIDCNVCAGPVFMAWILEGRLREVGTPHAGCLVCYFSNSRWKHIGVMGVDDRVTSKWGAFPAYEHALDEVQESYGDEVRFFEPPSPDAPALFLEFAAEKGVSADHVAHILKDCSDLWTDEPLT
jgi:hypothetical protein